MSSNSSSRVGAPHVDSPVSVWTATSQTTAGNDGEPWMETATSGKFHLFQQQIFPIIESLTTKPEHANHPFTKKWARLKKIPNNPMAVDITWRGVKIP
jgi:hypothetical protein